MGYWILLIVVLLVAGLLVYVRMAPSDPDRWHSRAPDRGTETQKRDGGYIWRKTVSGDGADALAALDRAAMADARTTRLAGSVEEGQITYVSRTPTVGFPDYTTVGLYDVDGQRILEAYGRLRFGRSDMGVNAKRIRGWVADAGL